MSTPEHPDPHEDNPGQHPDPQHPDHDRPQDPEAPAHDGLQDPEAPAHREGAADPDRPTDHADMNESDMHRDQDRHDDDLDNASDEERDRATEEPGGLGKDGTIPSDPDGVAAGHTGTPSTFEPEEDEQAPSR